MKRFDSLPPSAIGLLVAVGLASSAPAAFQDHEPFARQLSEKPVQEIAGCFALALAKVRGVEIDNRDRPDGIDLAVKVRAAGIAITNTIYEIRDLGDRREVRGYMLKRPKEPNGSLPTPLAKCM